MSESRWQHDVLRDLGMSRRGLAASRPAAPGSDSWGAEAAPQPVEQTPFAQPPVAQPPAVNDAPPPYPAEPDSVAMRETAASDLPPPPQLQPHPEPPAPQPQPEPQPPMPVAGFPEPPVQEPPSPPVSGFPEPVAPPMAEPPSAFGTSEQPAPPSVSGGFPEPAEAAPPVGQPSAFADPPAHQEPEPPQNEQPQVDLFTHEGFNWDQAVNPVLGSVPAAEQGDEAAQQAAAQQQQQQQQAAQAPQGQGTAPHPASELVRKNQHGDPLMRRFGRGVLGAVGGGGARAAQEQAAFTDLMARTVPSYRQIAIASVRGGAGKTSMAAMLASELARHRQDRVLAADADAELGSLPLRLGVQSQYSLFDLEGQRPQTFEEAAQFLTRTPEGLWVMSSTRGGRIVGEFTLQTFQTALSAVSRFFGAAIVDCGAGILTEVNRGVVASSHALVLVTPGTVDGALSARGALEWFVANGQQELIPRTVIAMVSHAPQVGTDLERAREMLAAWGLPVVSVPYDRHVATGASLDLSKVGAATRQAAMRLVYEAFGRSLSGGA